MCEIREGGCIIISFSFFLSIPFFGFRLSLAGLLILLIPLWHSGWHFFLEWQYHVLLYLFYISRWGFTANYYKNGGLLELISWAVLYTMVAMLFFFFLLLLSSSSFHGRGFQVSVFLLCVCVWLCKLIDGVAAMAQGIDMDELIDLNRTGFTKLID